MGITQKITTKPNLATWALVEDAASWDCQFFITDQATSMTSFSIHPGSSSMTRIFDK